MEKKVSRKNYKEREGYEERKKKRERVANVVGRKGLLAEMKGKDKKKKD